MGMSAPEPGRVVQKGAAMASRHIFISFASSDTDLAHRVVEALERAAFRCWISDRDIEPGTSYPAAITAAVKASGVVLLLLTDASNSSPHVLREVELAFNARRPVLPVRIAGVTPSSDLQYFLSTTQWFDAGAAFDDADLARVEPRLRELLDGRKGSGASTDERRKWRVIAAVAAVAIIGFAALVLWMGRSPDAPIPSAEEAASPGFPTALESNAVADPGTPPASSAAQPTPAGKTSGAPLAKVNPRDGQAYVWVAPGQFIMGCSVGDPDCDDDETPVRMVEITRGYWLATTEVTNAQLRQTTPGHQFAEADEANLPAVALSWTAAKAHCAGVGGRLPTEAEWEFAARAGSTTRYYGSLPAIAWFADNSEERLHPVGMKTPNALGLHDMLGNAAEWVLDRYFNAYDDTSDPASVMEPLAPNASAVARGGSWVSESPGVRVSRRLGFPPDAEEPFIGVRCAVDRF